MIFRFLAGFIIGLAVAGVVWLGYNALPNTASPRPQTAEAALISKLTAAEKAAKIAPDFVLTAHTGAKVSLSQFRGKPVVLEWYNAGCPFVRKHYDSGNMPSLQQKYTSKGVIWLRIISSAIGRQGFMTQAEAAADHAANSHATFTLLDTNGEVGRLYGAQTTPHMFVISRAGLIVYQGAIDSMATPLQKDIPYADNYVADALDNVLAGKPVTYTSSTPYGCGIKY